MLGMFRILTDSGVVDNWLGVGLTDFGEHQVQYIV